MNDVSKKQKDSILKTLAIAGFIGIIILVAWLAIQFVNLAPTAFTSLASLAEGLNQFKQTISTEETAPADLVLTSDSTLVSTDSTLRLDWKAVDMNGSYIFSYECTDGVAVDLMRVDGKQSVACDTNYNVGDTNTLSLLIDSEKERYADLRTTIAFLATNDREPRASSSLLITVMNNDLLDSNEDTLVTEEESSEPDVDNVTEDTPPPTTPPAPVYEQQFVYQIPVSDPNGRTDLGVRFIAVGEIDQNTFTPGTIEGERGGAIQFEVKNYGTKTSAEWDFSVTTPGGGTYSAENQTPLKPNERAVLTIGFAPTERDSHEFVVIVTSPTDRNTLNDSFSTTVPIN